MAEQNRIIRIRKLTDQGHEPALWHTPPAERLDMMWQLALDAWAFKGEPLAESRLPRQVAALCAESAESVLAFQYLTSKKKTRRSGFLLSLN